MDSEKQWPENIECKIKTHIRRHLTYHPQKNKLELLNYKEAKKHKPLNANIMYSMTSVTGHVTTLYTYQ